MSVKFNKKFPGKKRASAFVDYSLLIFAVVSSLIIMGGYVQRAMMGKWKAAADVFGHGRQYGQQERNMPEHRPGFYPMNPPPR